MTVLDYSMMVEDSHVRTKLFEYRQRGIDSGINGRGEGQLLAVALTDVLSDGLSLVYSFYDPDQRAQHHGHEKCAGADNHEGCRRAHAGPPRRGTLQACRVPRTHRRRGLAHIVSRLRDVTAVAIVSITGPPAGWRAA